MDKIRSPKKLIEVALPLDDINAACAHEKMPGIGPHPRGIHLWWARRPLAAARAVLFAQLVNDPGGERGYKVGLTKAQAANKREELFDIIRELVKWENVNNQHVLERARKAIHDSWLETCSMNKGKPGFDSEKMPAFHDPFAGGGAIPLEAQRLGLESYASDLNPVAVMINKAMIEIPPRFRDSQPVGPLPFNEKKLTDSYTGAQGLAEDVRRYGMWMREEAQKRIGHLYPNVEVTADMASDRPDLLPYVGQKLTVIAWLWARTVKSPNPAFSHVDVPLVSSFVLSKKKGKEAYIEPVISDSGYTFKVRRGAAPEEADKGTKAGGRGADFCCLMSGMPISGNYIKSEGKLGRIGSSLLSIVCEGNKGRVYLSPLSEHVSIDISPSWLPQGDVPARLTGGTCVPYGLDKWHKLFTPRQLVALNTFSDLVQEAKAKAEQDAILAGMPDDGVALADGGSGAKAYGEAITVYLGFVVDRCLDFNNSIVGWRAGNEKIMNMYSRQAIPMSWDFAEANILENVVGGFVTNLNYQVDCLHYLPGISVGVSQMADAQQQSVSLGKVVSTDPPYYDNIGYADLSDFFYVWMRRNLRTLYPQIFSTITVPKAEELVASPYRHGGKEKAEAFFMSGMTDALGRLQNLSHPGFPITIYYAFKASETKSNSTSNAGWEAFLAALVDAGLSITGTWPMRSEQSCRMIGLGTNALASSIVLVCRKRSADAQVVSRRQFISELVQRMPEALEDMVGSGGENSPVAPVDLAQAAIGPGMEIFSKYGAVLKADGSPMSVHEAMIEINRQISDYLNPSGSGFDPETLFCDNWYQQYGWNEGLYGEADVLARAKSTSVEAVASSGVANSKGGKVQLIHWHDYPDDYAPEKDKKRPVWEACHHLIKAFQKGGEQAAGALLARMQEDTENIRQLAYHLYVYNERKGNAEEARYYNELMSCWSEIEITSEKEAKKIPVQATLDL